MNGSLDNFATFIYFDPVKQNQTDRMIFRPLSMLIKNRFATKINNLNQTS